MVGITPEGGEPFQCSSLNSASKLMKVSTSTVKYAYDKGKMIIIRRVNGERVFHLKWLKCRSELNWICLKDSKLGSPEEYLPVLVSSVLAVNTYPMDMC